MIAKMPALAAVKTAIIDDCKSKATAKDPDAYCACGAAVTFGFWGADEGMRTRLATYVNDPSATPATDFVKYQGPELFDGVCQDAGN